MFKFAVIFFVGLASLAAAIPASAELSPREQAERAAREAMARALAEKARNDAIVEKQRAAEKARRDTENFERACKRARTC